MKKRFKFLPKLFVFMFLAIGVFFATTPKAQAYVNNSYLIIITNDTENDQLFVFDIDDDSFVTYDYAELDIDDIVDYTIIRRGDALKYSIVSDTFEFWAYEVATVGYETFLELPVGFLETNLGAIYYFANGTGVSTGYANGYDAGYIVGVGEVESTAYNQGVLDGIEIGMADEANNFYDNIETWLVPAIIIVMFVGGVFSVIALKRRSEE